MFMKIFTNMGKRVSESLKRNIRKYIKFYVHRDTWKMEKNDKWSQDWKRIYQLATSERWDYVCFLFSFCMSSKIPQVTVHAHRGK